MPKKFLEIAPQDVERLKQASYDDGFVKRLDDSFFAVDWIEENKARLKDKLVSGGTIRVFRLRDLEQSARFKNETNQSRVLAAIAFLKTYGICGEPFLDGETPVKQYDSVDEIRIDNSNHQMLYCEYVDADRLAPDWQGWLIDELIKAKTPPSPPKEAGPQYMALKDFWFNTTPGGQQYHFKTNYVFTDPITVNAILADPHLIKEGYVRKVDEVTMFVCTHCGKASIKQ
jgi:hypothetical protein